jgi:hypothetical protein
MARDDSLIWMIITPILKWLKTRHALASITGTIVLLAVMAYIFAWQAEAFPAADPYNSAQPNPHPGIPDDAIEEVETMDGYAREGSPIDERVDLLGSTVWTMRVTFSATDEPPDRMRFTNEADDFEITVTLPDGTTESKTGYATDTNPAAITFTYDWKEDGGMKLSETDANTMVVTVDCTNADDQYPFFSPFNRRVVSDDGNDYTLVVDYSYTE